MKHNTILFIAGSSSLLDQKQIEDKYFFVYLRALLCEYVEVMLV